MKKIWIVLLVVVLLVFAVPGVAVAQDLADPVELLGVDVVALVSSALFVVAVVESVKKIFGVRGQALMLVGIVTGIVMQLLVFYFGGSPVFEVIMRGVLYGGAASGAWTLRNPADPASYTLEPEDLPLVE